MVSRLFRLVAILFCLSLFTVPLSEALVEIGSPIGDRLVKANLALSKTKAETQLLKLYQLPPDYNNLALPTKRNKSDSSGANVRIPIVVGIFIVGFRGVDELQEHISVELDLVVRWKDFIIDGFDNKTKEEFKKEYGEPYVALDSQILYDIWWPAMMFDNIVSITHPNLHSTQHPNPVQFRIYPGGHIQMKTRLILKLNCGMDFTYYPADTQTCQLRLRSYPFSDNDIELGWDRVLLEGEDEEHPSGPYNAYLNDRSDSSFYTFLHDVNTTIDETRGTVYPEKHTILQFSITAKRKLNFHIMQTFVPSSFLILITWLSFFLPTALLEARIGIAMTTVLTLTAMFSSIKEFTPHVSYVKAIDIWMMVCILVVFITLFEFTLLIWLRKTIEKNLKKNNVKSVLNRAILKMRPSLKESCLQDIETNEDKQRQQERVKREKSEVYNQVMRLAEKYGFVAVAGSFVMFNVIYWPWLLLASGHFKYLVNFDYNSPDP